MTGSNKQKTQKRALSGLVTAQPTVAPIPGRRCSRRLGDGCGRPYEGEDELGSALQKTDPVAASGDTSGTAFRSRCCPSPRTGCGGAPIRYQAAAWTRSARWRGLRYTGIVGASFSVRVFRTQASAALIRRHRRHLEVFRRRDARDLFGCVRHPLRTSERHDYDKTMRPFARRSRGPLFLAQPCVIAASHTRGSDAGLREVPRGFLGIRAQEFALCPNSDELKLAALGCARPQRHTRPPL